MPPARPEVARGVLRGARAAVLAATALGLAATAHVVGGGTLPPLPVLCLVVVPLAWGAVVLTARALGPVVLSMALGAAQVALHQALMVLSAPTCALGAANGMAGMTGVHGAQTGAAASAVAMCSTHAMPGTAVATAGAVTMLAGHAVATLLTAALLARGERALATMLALLSRPLRRIAAVVVHSDTIRVPFRATRAWPEVVRLASAALDAAGGRRAPPRWNAAASTR